MAMTDLPVELIYPILDLLNAEDILFAFRLVCRQFYRIVENYDRLKIQLRWHTSKATIQRLCRIVRPKNVTSLLFEKYSLNSGNIECLFQSAAIDQFNRLRSLTLDNIETDDLERFVTPLSTNSTLTSVTVCMRANSRRRYYTAVSYWKRIIMLANIRQLTLDIDSKAINAISWPKDCTIERLTLRGCSYRQFCNIFDRSPNLKDFILNDNFTGDLDSSIRPETCRSLTSLTLKEIDLPTEDLEFFLSLHPCLISLTLTTQENVSRNTFQHFSRWEKFLQSTLPLLKNFNFSMSNQCNQFENVESILSPLCTSFWLEKKHWFFTCQYTEGSSVKTIKLYSSTYSTAQFPDSLNDDNLSYAITTMRSGNQSNRSRMWSARVNLTWMINAIIANTFKVPDQHYFRHVTRLAFDVDVNPEWSVDALQHISTWIDLSQLHEIWILETSPCELQFDAIEFLLAQAPQVRTFGLTYNDLPSRIIRLGSVVSGRIDHLKIRDLDILCFSSFRWKLFLFTMFIQTATIAFMTSLRFIQTNLYRIDGPILVILDEQSSYSAMLNISEPVPPPESVPSIPELVRLIPELNFWSDLGNILLVYTALLALVLEMGYNINPSAYNLVCCRVRVYVIFLADSLSSFYLIPTSIAYYSLVLAILMPCLMIVFGSLAIRNLRSLRHINAVARTVTNGTNNLRAPIAKDTKLIRIALINIIVYVVLGSLMTIFFMYLQMTQYQIKSDLQK
ncbi:unnamed protein product [Rotaria magnacalcarata]|uniref:F-box domain-containing protein n=2 Tax=Rotaria magnacalcarata TaxID=392030 RepID=A0A819K9T8_9BILA|nr:unnamed protein product [Rotaria magnacalcarata]